jgi:hypothetical protein
VFYLPSYIPELNPDEMLNANLNSTMTSKAPERTKWKLPKTTTRQMRKLQKSPERVINYIEHATAKYAAYAQQFIAGSIGSSGINTSLKFGSTCINFNLITNFTKCGHL